MRKVVRMTRNLHDSIIFRLAARVPSEPSRIILRKFTVFDEEGHEVWPQRFALISWLGTLVLQIPAWRKCGFVTREKEKNTAISHPEKPQLARV